MHYAKSLFSIFLENHLISDDLSFSSLDSALVSVFGSYFVYHCSYILSVKCRSYSYDRGVRLLDIFITYVGEDGLEHRTIPYYSFPISDYKFRKLRIALKENGYI